MAKGDNWVDEAYAVLMEHKDGSRHDLIARLESLFSRPEVPKALRQEIIRDKPDEALSCDRQAQSLRPHS